MAMTPLPAAPQRTDPTNFTTKADAFVAALPTFVTEANALEVNVNAKEASAVASAAAALASEKDAETAAANAASILGATKWVSGTTYAEGVCVWSPTDYTVYRRKTNGAGTTDPASDGTNWIGVNLYAAADAVLAREPDQGVAMTAAASGSSGITVADNDNIDFGTGNFTLVWKGSLPDWAPSVSHSMIQKYSDAYSTYMDIDTGGMLSTVFGVSTAAIGAVNNTVHEIVMTVVRETASSAGVLTYYLDGIILGNAVAIAQGSPTTVSNSAALMLLGYGATRYAGTTHHAYTFNRALTAAEVLDLYRNGIAESDKWGSQTNINSTTWASSGGYDYDTFETASAAGFHAADVAPTSDKRAYIMALPVVAGKKYRASWTPTLTSGTDPGFVIKQENMTGTAYASTNLSTASVEFTATLSENISVFFLSNAAADFTVAGFTFTEIGATLCLLPENAQPSPGQWIDASTNLLHAMQPATGSSLTRPKDTFTVKWTNTWAGTHEAQYIGGVDQAVLPPNCYVQSIIGVITGSTIEDIIIGDGSDTDHWVAITTGLAAGTVNFTVANAISDGTNYKLVVDPDANFTGSIVWTIKGIVL